MVRGQTPKADAASGMENVIRSIDAAEVFIAPLCMGPQDEVFQFAELQDGFIRLEIEWRSPRVRARTVPQILCVVARIRQPRRLRRVDA
jgi:hypothetical protein